MRKHKRKNKKSSFIIVFITLLLALSISYAMPDDILNINGTMNVKLDAELIFNDNCSMIIAKSNNYGEHTGFSLSEDKHKLNINITDLEQPGAKVAFNVEVKNIGTSPAKALPFITEGIPNLEYIKITGLNSINDTTILEDETYNFELVIEIPDNAVIPENSITNVAFTIELDYTQEETADLQTYLVNYDGNGADSGTMDSSIHICGNWSELNENTYTKEGHTFLGWSKNSTDTVATYSDKQLVKDLTENTSVTLFAIWEETN